MHGFDWDAARAKYQPLVDYIGDRQELMNIINEMIGELNASHTGAAQRRRTRGRSFNRSPRCGIGTRHRRRTLSRDLHL